MGNREEALRRIFDATGVGARLTDEQKRELLTHLEDAVEKKIGAGVPEIDAVGQAFSELGDLEKIARQFPDKPAAVTPEGVVLAGSEPAYGWMTFTFLVFFNMMGVFVVPRFMGIFSQVRVPLPGLTLLFMNVSNALRSTAGIAGIALFFAGLLVLRWKRIRVPRPVYQTILIGSVVLCFGMLISLFLPLVTLLEGIGMRR